MGDVVKALKYILQKDLTDVVDGLRMLANALDGWMEAMRECKASEADMKDIVHVLAEFKGIKTFSLHIFNDLIKNYKDLMVEFGSSLKAYEGKQYEECGRQLGMALHRVVVGKPHSSTTPLPASTTASPSTTTPDPQRRRQILEGLMEGFVSDQPDLKGCVGGAGTAFGDVGKALKDIVKKDLADVANGLRKLAAALDVVPGAMKECKASEADVKEIVHVLNEFKGLKKFTLHVSDDVIRNYKDLMVEFGSSARAYEGKQYEECGRQLGMALHRVVVGKPPSLSSSPFCKDHAGCADLYPADGLCCAGADGTGLACCDLPSSSTSIVAV